MKVIHQILALASEQTAELSDLSRNERRSAHAHRRACNSQGHDSSIIGRIVSGYTKVIVDGNGYCCLRSTFIYRYIDH
jgi:hypothetical protein